MASRLGNAVLLGLLLVVAPLHAAKLELVVEEVNGDAEACGIQKSTLRSIASLVLRNNRIELVEVTEGDFFYVAASVAQINPGTCAGMLQVQLQTLALYRPGAIFRKSKTAGSPMALCVKDMLTVSGRAAFPKLISDNLETMTKVCLGEHSY